MSEQDKRKEEEVLNREADPEEMKAVTGGKWGDNWGEDSYFDPTGCSEPSAADVDRSNCVYNHARNIYAGSFPNCAATVGDGSWCMNNDACFNDAVDYQGMTDCSKAWR